MQVNVLKKELYFTVFFITVTILGLFLYNQRDDDFDQLLKNLFKDTQNYEYVDSIVKELLIKGESQRAISVLFKLIDYNEDNNYYNAYYLFLIAGIYYDKKEYPLAIQYYKLIVNNYNDLIIKERSIHYQSYIRLINLEIQNSSKIKYYLHLIKFYKQYINEIDVYYELGKLYEQDNKIKTAFEYYDKVLRYYNRKYPILISDFAIEYNVNVPQYYYSIRDKMDFYYSSRDWLYSDLNVLIRKLRNAVENHDYYSLESLKAKKGFYFTSFIQNSEDFASKNQKNIQMVLRSFVSGGQNIVINPNLESFSSSSEAYLKTSGWGYRVSVWYFYFKKVEYIKGYSGWEWKGIIFGEKQK